MEKLIELLNEYEKEKKPSRLQRNYYFVHNGIMYIDEEGEDVDDYKTDYEIINKEYGFIKWLVENDKIDFSNTEFYFLEREQYTKEESLIMILSISSSPIDDLISYLR